MRWTISVTHKCSAYIMFCVLVDVKFHTAALLADHIDGKVGWDCMEIRLNRKTGLRQLLVKCNIQGDQQELSDKLASIVTESIGPNIYK